jgi:hypothetical protein
MDFLRSFPFIRVSSPFPPVLFLLLFAVLIHTIQSSQLQSSNLAFPFRPAEEYSLFFGFCSSSIRVTCPGHCNLLILLYFTGSVSLHGLSSLLFTIVFYCPKDAPTDPSLKRTKTFYIFLCCHQSFRRTYNYVPRTM